MASNSSAEAAAAATLVAAVFLAFIFALALPFLTAWLLMLFLGNLGVHVGYLGALPGAFLLQFAKAKVNFSGVAKKK